MKPKRPLFYQPAPNLKFFLDRSGQFRAKSSTSAGDFVMAPELLLLLSLLVQSPTATPKEHLQALNQGLKQLRAQLPSVPEWQQLQQEMAAAQLLIPVGNDVPESSSSLTDGFGDSWIQWAMVSDQPRFEAYQRGLQETVTAVSRVLDVGAGTGLLSALALSCGASQVYALEETASYRSIDPLLQKLGFSRNRYEVLVGHSAHLELPEGIDVVVSELFGNDPLSEGLIPTLMDLGTRLPEKTRFIPEGLEIFIELAQVSRDCPLFPRLAAFAQTDVSFANNTAQNRKNLDFTSVLTAIKSALLFDGLLFPYAFAPQHLKTLGKSHRVGHCSLNHPKNLLAQACKAFNHVQTLPFHPADRANKENGVVVVLVWFRITVVQGVTLSSHPNQKDRAEHWSPLVLPLTAHDLLGSSIPVRTWVEPQDGCSLNVARNT